MDLYEAIISRRSTKRFTEEPPPKEVLEKALESACWAPSHRNSQPWEFRVLTGEAKRSLCDVYASQIMSHPKMPEEKKAKKAGFAKDFGGARVIVLALCRISENAADDYENAEALGAAMQNFALALQNEGLTTIWLTPSILLNNKHVKEMFKVADDQRIAGIFPVGYSSDKPQVKLRTPLSEKMIWFD